MSYGYGMGGFDAMFTIVPVFISIVFVLVLGIIVVAAVQGIGTWNKNNHSPRLTVPAQVVTKRTDVSRRRHNSGTGMRHTHTSTRYYATFQVDSGDRMEFSVSGPEYGMLAEGDRGDLTFQGTRYLSFERS